MSIRNMKTYEQGQIYLFLLDNFLMDCIDVQINSDNSLIVTDKLGESLIFYYDRETSKVTY